MDNPKVSILIPLYDSEEYIAETIESCLDQTYKNIEIIIVDDGSSDSGLSIARDYELKYTNIKVDTQKNSGAPVARNKAFELSTGEYIQYIDADDLLHPDKIRLQIEVLKRADGRTIAFGRWGTFQKSIENVIWKDLPVNKDYDEPKQFLIELWASGMAAITHVWIVPRILVEESGGWDESLVKNQDGEFFARVVAKSHKILFVVESVGYYRKDNDNSISRQVSRKALRAALKSYDTYVELMKNDLDKADIQKVFASLYSQFIYRHYPSYMDIIKEAEEKVKSFGYDKPIMKMKNYELVLSKLIGTYNLLKLKRYAQKISLCKYKMKI